MKEHDNHEKSSDKDKQGNPQASTDEGKKIKNMDHEGNYPKHVLATSPRQGAMTSSPKLNANQQGRNPRKAQNCPKRTPGEKKG